RAGGRGRRAGPPGARVLARRPGGGGVAGPPAAPPAPPPPAVPAEIRALACDYWPLGVARELDDLILHLRTNEPAIGLWVWRTRGSADLVEAYDRGLLEGEGDWLLREVRLFWKRTLKPLDRSSRSLFALRGPC